MSYLEGFTEEQVKAMRADPRQYAYNMLRHPIVPSRRWDFGLPRDPDEKTYYLLSDDGPLNPENWGNINILNFCRGGLKTTTLNLLTTWYHHMYLPWGVRTYMTAPRKQQMKRFSKKTRETMEDAGLDGFRDTDSVKEQSFKLKRNDENGGQFQVVSKYMADSGWGTGDALRGPHTAFGVIDEFQDISRAAFETYISCIDQVVPGCPYFPAIFLIGTPNEEGSFFHQTWEKTDKRTWDRSEMEWVVQDDRKQVKPPDDVIIEAGRDPDDVEPLEYAGWHLDVYNSPVHPPTEIERDRQSMTEKKFANEDLAQFHSSEDSLLSRDIVHEHFDSDERFTHERQFEDSQVVVGADWGGGTDDNAADTVFVVGEYVDDGAGVTCYVRHLEFRPPGESRQDRIEGFETVFNRFDADLAVVDYGHSESIYEDLQDGTNTLYGDYRHSVKAAKFGNVSNKDQITWETQSGKRRFFSCDKTRSSVRMVEAFRDGEFTIPAGNDEMDTDVEDSKGDKLATQLSAPFKDRSTTNGKKKITIDKHGRVNDDAFDAFTYLYLAYHEVDASVGHTSVDMSAREGVVN